MEQKIKNLLQFYLLATELKDKIRSGWKVWSIDRERIESVAEHIYGVCILAIAIDSQFELQVDLHKIVMMLVLHEVEEIRIGDLTPFDKQTQELLNEGAKSIADLFIENDRPIFTEKVFENIADYVKNNELLKLRKEN